MPMTTNTKGEFHKVQGRSLSLFERVEFSLELGSLGPLAARPHCTWGPNEAGGLWPDIRSSSPFDSSSDRKYAALHDLDSSSSSKLLSLISHLLAESDFRILLQMFR